MVNAILIDFAELYREFHSPVTEFDCGDRCAPYNERGVPFCCDINHAVPAAYQDEWTYLRCNTNLWRPWQSDDTALMEALNQQTPPGQVLISCLGHLLCQREYRSITCRSFPFFPYITLSGEFIGLSYYWQYEDRCWVISHLEMVSEKYLSEFVKVFDFIFEQMPEELATYRHFGIIMRRVFGRKHRSIPLLHRNGMAYKVSPRTGQMRRCTPNKFSQFGPYQIAAELPFPDELPQE